MKVGVIGANGQLGSDICLEFSENGHQVVGLNHDRMDVADPESVSSVLGEIRPDIIVNTAAMHNLDRCEEEPVRSFEVNGMGSRHLAFAANRIGALIVHVSTDYVFDGKKGQPYVETDPPCPLNVYGNTKLSGEYFIRSIAEKYFIVRVSGIYGVQPCRAKGGLNFIRLMLKLAAERDEVRVVDDEIVSPTNTRDVARQIVQLVRTDAYGLYHATSQGECSWHAFARAIFDMSKSRVKLSKAGPDEFPAKVPRPKYSVLENQQLQDLGIDIMPHWHDALGRYLGEILDAGD